MIWDIDPVLFTIPLPFGSLGPLEIRYYGVFFATGLLLGASAFPRYFEQRGLPRKHGERLTLWTPIGMLIGAHLVHLIFYEPESFINNPRRIIEIGSGLASHGGGLGAILAVWLFARKNKVDLHRYLDPAMCGAVWVIPFVRIGNFFNSEIVGRASDVPWAITFVRYPGAEVPRHPSQIYEAILGFMVVGLAVYLQRKWRDRLRPGATFYILLAAYFTSRIGVEYVKEYQALSPDLPFTMGQLLSVPIVLFSLGMIFLPKTPLVSPAGTHPTEADLPPDGDEPAPSAKEKARRVKAKKAKAQDETPEAAAADPEEGTSRPRPAKARKRKKKKAR